MLITFTWLKSFRLLVKGVLSDNLRRSGTKWRHGQTQTAHLKKQCCLQQIPRSHWERPPRRVTSPKQRRDAMRQRPDVQCHHQDWGTLLRRHGGDEPLGGSSQHGKGTLPRFLQFWARFGRDAGLEHGGIVGWLALCEPKIGFAEAVEGCEGIWTAAVPGAFKWNRESVGATPSHLAPHFVSAGKMSGERPRDSSP